MPGIRWEALQGKFEEIVIMKTLLRSLWIILSIIGGLAFVWLVLRQS